MYRAKLVGKGRYQFFDRAEDLATRSLQESRQQISQALKNDEFVLFYQPKVNMRTGEVLGAEALIRWDHPERGLLSPAQFLPLVENDDLALVMGQWVIEQALAQLKVWNERGLCLEVSVNVFARQLQEDGFVASLQSALARFPEVKPEQFTIEVLETSALAELAKISSIIDQCWALGVKSALDDFGTGYSTLAYLKGLPAAILKIDQTFVRDMLDDPEDLAILNGVLGLANAFGRIPIAEGVETERHGELLLDLGCELAQGYGIARPMPADEFPGWLDEWAPNESWQSRPIRGDQQIRLIFAMVEHRAWVKSIEKHLESGQACPPLDRDGCAFARWLNEHGHAMELSDHDLAQLNDLHAKAHRVAEDVIEGDGETSLEDLFEVRDQLLVCLDEIEQSLCKLDRAH
jgi:EAL domain-containing protein (putative c-di-GMP-specific phosphodiesterase class I)